MRRADRLEHQFLLAPLVTTFGFLPLRAAPSASAVKSPKDRTSRQAYRTCSVISLSAQLCCHDPPLIPLPVLDHLDRFVLQTLPLVCRFRS